MAALWTMIVITGRQIGDMSAMRLCVLWRLTMREIEFRAKCLDDNNWVFGDLRNTWYLFNGERCYYRQNAFLQLEGIIPETVCQYTGLKDKNGAKIFEGDILEWGHCKRICHVSWLEDTAMFLYITVDRKLIYPGEASACAVIGNIHDNPELLEASCSSA